MLYYLIFLITFAQYWLPTLQYIVVYSVAVDGCE